ncbi:hypothetical protein HZS_6893 [Henneguya salminicola]|nr:hypothetical protein HZS_6893 [Henneguya salminicola]
MKSVFNLGEGVTIVNNNKKWAIIISIGWPSVYLNLPSLPGYRYYSFGGNPFEVFVDPTRKEHTKQAEGN